MHRQMLTVLVCACALAAPASASADTLTLTNTLGEPAAFADFESSSTAVITPQGSFECDGIALATEITQNAADPVTLQLADRPWHYLATAFGDCQTATGVTIGYSNIELTGPMELNADGTGTLPLRFTETWNGASTYSCVREGVLDLVYAPNQSANQQVGYSGWLNMVSGLCPISAHWQGTFDTPTEDYSPIEFVVTP